MERIIESGDPPWPLEHLWEWFAELAAARTGNGFGPNPISYAEIASWAALRCAAPSAWEVSLLRRMDSAWLMASRPPDKNDPVRQVAADNVSGVSGLFAGLKARAGVERS